jgi:hypothetical protein
VFLFERALASQWNDFGASPCAYSDREQKPQKPPRLRAIPGYAPCIDFFLCGHSRERAAEKISRFGPPNCSPGETKMKVYIQDSKSCSYYAGKARWATHADMAVSFPTVQGALDCVAADRLARVRLMLHYTDGRPDLYLDVSEMPPPGRDMPQGRRIDA